MDKQFKVEVFQFQCNVESFPPSLGCLKKIIADNLPSQAILLQWAIVRSDREESKLWIEGSHFFVKKILD